MVEDRCHVLVEGRSDAVVIAHLAAREGLADRLRVVVMDGVTNAGRHVRRLAATAPDGVVLGLCDVGERRFLLRVEPALDAVHACDRDLEEELIRAVGPDAVLRVLAEAGELGRFRTFQGQPEWRDRPVAAQLHRFAGTRSGRKAALALGLASRLDATTTPPPLAALLDDVRRLTG